MLRPEVSAHFARHHGVIHRRQAATLGVTDAQIARLVRTGRWKRVHPSVYHLSDLPFGPESCLAAACLAGGTPAAASHHSALWLWDLVDRPPDVPVISVTRRQNPRLERVVVHRRSDLHLGRLQQRRLIPVTDPLRSLCDVGASLPSVGLDVAVDRALATRLVSVEGLMTEAGRLSHRGRTGVRDLRASLIRRGMVGGPQPSVLESRALRILRAVGIVPVGCEVAVAGGRYRLDFVLRPGLALEVDGFAYHSSPEAKSADSRRRNRLRLAGFVVLESDWIEVTQHPSRLQATVLEALAVFDAARS